MDVAFANSELEKLAFDADYIGAWEPHVVQKYRNVIVYMQASSNRESLFRWRGLRFEGLSGKRKGVRKKQRSKEYSVRLSRKLRVVFTFEAKGNEEAVLILAIEDYH